MSINELTIFHFSTLKMALLRLPREILRAILDHALLDLGLQRLLRLRTVCRMAPT